MTNEFMYASVLPQSGPHAQMRYQRVPSPEPGPDEVLVKVAAAALDRVDTYIRRGSHGMTTTEEQILGRDMAGIVAAIGANVTDLRVGDEVIALGRSSHAEYAVAPYRHTMLKPPHWSFAEAAALPTAGRTAYDAVYNIARVCAGESLLVVAAGGAVGSFALQYGVSLGAAVYATVGTEEKAATARRFGARAALDHYSPEFVNQVLAASGGAQMDVIIDPVGGALYEDLLRLLGRDGRIVTCGVTAGARATVHLGKLMTQGWHIHGIGRPDHKQIASHLRGSLNMMASAGRRPIVDRVFPLSDAEAAHEYLEQSTFFGRIVLTTEFGHRL